MKPGSPNALAWVHLSLHPLRYAHTSWQPQLPVALDALSPSARQALEAQVRQQLQLQALTPADAQQAGASVGLITPAVHATLVDALLALSAPDSAPAAAGSPAAQLASQLGRQALPWRRLHAASADPAGSRRLLAEQLAARLCAAAASLGGAWASRWRLRHPRALKLDGVRTTATAAWWAHIESCLHELHGGPEKLPCL